MLYHWPPKSPFRSPSKNIAPVTQWDPQSACPTWILSKVADLVYGQISHVGLKWVYPCGTHMGCPPLPHLRRPMRPMSIPHGAHMGSPSAAHVPRGPIWPMQTPYLWVPCGHVCWEGGHPRPERGHSKVCGRKTLSLPSFGRGPLRQGALPCLISPRHQSSGCPLGGRAPAAVTFSFANRSWSCHIRFYSIVPFVTIAARLLPVFAYVVMTRMNVEDTKPCPSSPSQPAPSIRWMANLGLFL